MRLVHSFTLAFTVIALSVIWSRALNTQTTPVYVSIIVPPERAPTIVHVQTTPVVVEPTPIVVEPPLTKVVIEPEPTPIFVEPERGTIEGRPREHWITGKQWFEMVRPYCSAGEVVARLERNPPPPGFLGGAYTAACYTLAGQLMEAREALGALGPMAEAGAQVVYHIVFPSLDPGSDPDDMPTIEFLLEFSPRDLEARYRAGQYRLQRGDFGRAADYLQVFESHRLGDEYRPSPKDLLKAARQGN